MQDNTSHIVLLCKEGRRARAYRPPVQDDVVGIDVQVLRQVEVDCLDVIVERNLSWDLSVALSESSVLIDYRIYLDMLEEVGLEPGLDEIDVLCVPVGKNDGVLGVAVDEEDLEL